MNFKLIRRIIFMFIDKRIYEKFIEKSSTKLWKKRKLPRQLRRMGRKYLYRLKKMVWKLDFSSKEDLIIDETCMTLKLLFIHWGKNLINWLLYNFDTSPFVEKGNVWTVLEESHFQNINWKRRDNLKAFADWMRDERKKQVPTD